jgi:hypothetical protein
VWAGKLEMSPFTMVKNETFTILWNFHHGERRHGEIFTMVKGDMVKFSPGMVKFSPVIVKISPFFSFHQKAEKPKTQKKNQVKKSGQSRKKKTQKKKLARYRPQDFFDYKKFESARRYRLHFSFFRPVPAGLSVHLFTLWTRRLRRKAGSSMPWRKKVVFLGFFSGTGPHIWWYFA